MDKINRHNYEVFFIDYFDGNLTPDQTNELFLFLNENPDLKEEFDSFEEIPIHIPNETFAAKETLKKNPDALINAANFEEFCIASVENDLTEIENEALVNYLRANHLEKEFDIFRNLKLKAPDEIFTEKDGLKKLRIDNDYAEINESSINEFAIAYHEGDINETTKNNVASFINTNADYRNLLNDYRKTYLVPEKISYPLKSALKKFSLAAFSSRIIPYASAAAVLLFFVLLFSVGKMENNELSTLTEIEKKPVVKPGIKPVLEKGKDQKADNNPKDEKNKDVDEKEVNKEPKVKTEIRENSSPIPNLQIISPIKKNNLVVTNAGIIQIADVLNQSSPVKEVSFVSDPEFEAIIAKSQSREKEDEKYYKIGELVADRVKKDILKTNEEKFSLWQIAQAGARGLSKITGKEYKVETGIDENGNVALMAINTQNFEYSRTKK